MNKIDWNKMWRDSEDAKEHSDNLEFWNGFAPKFRKKTGKNDLYIDRFYEYMGAKPTDTLFDMGCGSGTLAIPFAQKGHEVFAADFSPEMLKYLKQGAEEAGVADRIHTIELNWNEDWSKRELPMCDIAFSSRSFITRDMSESLRKLESVARRRICIGAWDYPVSGYDRYVAKAIGYRRPGIGTHYMIMGELLDRDVLPELRFIYSPFRLAKYASREEAEERIRGSFSCLTDEQEAKLADYLAEHLIHIDEPGEYQGKDMPEYWQLDHDDMSTMAFISWEKANIY